MKRIILISSISLFALFVLNSCNKSSDGGSIASKLISSTSSSDGSSSSFEYNSNGTIAKQTTTFGSTISTYSFTYSGSTITIESARNGTTQSIGIYSLNSAGLASSYSTTNTGQSTPYYIKNYFYDGNGYLIKVISNNVGFSKDTTYYTVAAGNKSTITSGTINNLNSTSYTYFTDKINTIGNQNIGAIFLGKDNVNLVQQENYTYSGTLYSSTTTYQYAYNTDGSVQKLTRTYTPSSGTPTTSWTSFTYK